MGPTEVYRTPAEVRTMLDQWRALAEAVEDLCYFATPDWALAWWERIGTGRETEVAAWRDHDGSLGAVVALARSDERVHPRIPVRVAGWTNLGSGAGAADHCAWPVLPRWKEDVRAWLSRKASDSPLVLDHLDPQLGSPLVPQAARLVDNSPCPRISIPSPDEPLGGSKHFRKHLRQYERKIEGRGVTFRWIGPHAMDEAVLMTVLDLHARRQAMLDRATMFDARRAGFHRGLISLGGPGRGPAAILAEHHGEPVGAIYGFLWRDVFAYYQTGWDPSWEEANLGSVLVARAIRLAGEAGARVFDFLRGAEAYKYRFGGTDRVDETWIVPTGPSGWLLERKLRWKARRRPAQQIFEQQG